MREKQFTIQISGKTKSGMSTVCLLLKRILETEGFEVDIHDDASQSNMLRKALNLNSILAELEKGRIDIIQLKENL